MVHIKNSLNICERPKYLHAVYQLCAGGEQKCKYHDVEWKGWVGQREGGRQTGGQAGG